MVGESSTWRNAIRTDLLHDPRTLQRHITETLYQKVKDGPVFPGEVLSGAALSSVMLLLGRMPVEDGGVPEICLVLNKRSKEVRQSGDLCCPGGMVETRLDPYLARLLSLPGSPLSMWPHWAKFRSRRPRDARMLSLLFATALRESWEEMRLNPLGVRFLGPLPSQRLLLFYRVIHPMVGWVRGQTRFRPSWEVEKIVTIPLGSLLNPIHYAVHRLYVPPRIEEKIKRGTQDYPCFLCRRQGQTEMLWGATYRIVMTFMESIFGFTPPDSVSLPLVPGVMNESYICGRE
jgi:hypothetical protein